MRFVIAAVALGLTAPALGTPAEKPTLACLETAQDNGADPQHCVGLIVASCKRAGASDVDCAARELAFWQSKLDKAWKEAKPVLAGYPDLARDQRDAQALWLQYRDKSCAIADKVDPGTMPGGSAACRMRETAARAIAVGSIVDSLSEH
ncbi:MAG TPA: lysozyme inhibitor LprI family protein [Rhizomicrobium sp.]|jgi:uncharacterized protein YecT (DUF1311 family)